MSNELVATALADSTKNINLSVGLNGNLDKLVGSVNDVFNQIAAKIGSTSEHLWQVLIYQQQISAYTTIGVFLVFLISCLVFLSLGKLKEGSCGTGDDPTVKGVLFFIGYALLIVSFLFLLIEGPIVTNKLVNPEYIVIQTIMRNLGQTI